MSIEPFSYWTMLYAFIIGRVMCWAELYFALRLAGKRAKPVIYAGYIVADTLLMSVQMFFPNAPYLGVSLLEFALLLCVLRLAKAPFGVAILSCSVIFIPSMFWSTFSALLVQPLTGQYGYPIATLLIAGLRLIGLPSVYFLLILSRRFIEGDRKPTMAFALIPFAFLIFSGIVMAQQEGVIEALRAMRSEMVLMVAWLVITAVAFYAVLSANHKAARMAEINHEKHLLERDGRIKELTEKEILLWLEDARAYQHDIRNHMLVISGLLKKQSHKEAVRYLDSIITASDGLNPRISSGNPALDILLEEKIRFAEKEGISVNADIQARLFDELEETDICILLANGLDNAISACLEADNDHRSIDIDVKNHHSFLLIEIRNTVKDGLPPVKYGTGLKNMDKIASKYDGSLETEMNDGIFRLSVLLSFTRHSTLDIALGATAANE